MQLPASVLSDILTILRITNLALDIYKVRSRLCMYRRVPLLYRCVTFKLCNLLRVVLAHLE